MIQDLDCQKAPDTLVGSLNGTYCKRRATFYTFGLSSGSGTFGFCSGSGSVRVLNPSGFVRG